jgi:hypothetical protein
MGERSMDRITAGQIDTVLANVVRQLDSSVALVQAKCDADEFQRYRRIIGKVMGEIFVEIQEPLYNKYPELTPPGLRQEPR